jgi:prolyl 4-hydroxylase
MSSKNARCDNASLMIPLQTTAVGPSPNELLVVDDFISPDECNLVLGELEFASWRRSMTYVLQADGSRLDELSPLRVSETAQQKWFSEELAELLANLELRMRSIANFDIANLEYWQATRYPRKGTFYYHLDAGYWDDHYAGDRIFTFLLYLTTPSRGGGTHFRALDKKIEARAGRLAVWDNLFPSGGCNHRMIHSSVPLLSGRKVTLITWARQGVFRV